MVLSREVTYDLTCALNPSGCYVKTVPQGTQEDAWRLLPKSRPRCISLDQGGRSSGGIRHGEIPDIFLKEAHRIWI